MSLWYSIDQDFNADGVKPHRLQFETPTLKWPTAIIRPKSKISNIKHYGILPIENSMLMINNHFDSFQLPGD
jgi:hypothetical protein